MNECKICSKDIKKDSQYINGNYYHNECIEKLEHNWNELKKYFKRQTIDLEKVREDISADHYIDRKMFLKKVLNKMQSLEEGGNNE